MEPVPSLPHSDQESSGAEAGGVGTQEEAGPGLGNSWDQQVGRQLTG